MRRVKRGRRRAGKIVRPARGMASVAVGRPVAPQQSHRHPFRIKSLFQPIQRRMYPLKKRVGSANQTDFLHPASPRSTRSPW